MSILTGRLTKDLEKACALNDEEFEKALVYSANMIKNQQTSNRLSELIEIDPSDEEGLLSVLVDFLGFLAKYKLNEKEFQTLMDSSNIPPEKVEIINKVYNTHNAEMRENLNLLDDENLPTFKNLDWRFDIQIASRTFNAEFKPKILLNFDFVNKDKTHSEMALQSDLATLKHVQEELQKALRVNQSSNYMRFAKNFK